MQDNIVRPNDFVKIENADVVTESDLFTYTFSGFDTNKLTVSESNSGNIVLTPVGNATGTFNVTVTAESKLDNSTVSDTFPVPPIESSGIVLESRLKTDNELFASGTSQLTTTYFGDRYSVVAVEDFGGMTARELYFNIVPAHS